MGDLQAVHFAVDLSGELAYIDADRVLALKHVEGDLVAPDRVQATIRTRTLGSTTEIGMVGIGGEQWARNPASGRWETLPPAYGTFDLPALFDRDRGLANVLRSHGFAIQPQTEIDGSPQYVLATTARGEDLAAMTSGLIMSGAVDVQIAIDGETFALTQITLVETDTDADDPTRWQITLSRFNQPATIIPPVAQ